MRIAYLMSLLCLLPALHTTPTFAAAAPPVIVGFYDFPPSIYTDAEGKPQGPLVEVMHKVFHQAGYPMDARVMPSARLYAGIQDGSVQVWVGPPKSALTEHVLLGRHKISQLALNLYYRADTPAPQVPVDLIGREVVMIGGYKYSPVINRYLDDPSLHIIQHRTRTHSAALEMLLRQRGDYLLDYSVVVDQAAETLAVPMPAHVEVERLFIHFQVSRAQPNAQKLLDDLDQAYQTLLEAGEDLSTPGNPVNQRRGLTRAVGSATSGSSGQ
ncbi:transporter substrate-binding domain-containing protein [Pseudomonas sp. LS44]|uniref:substrate-binding periplasmic protein n=1 Tax=Pseudomonas sp. LS44 TaxID=1357074 RepID=UPI00215AB863|nr:transporter substrate-binding domain-containing protein [Pseudomonas sp. LS44]UVE18413.1 transporter substrate-binding domain-containing protein [Pseudomonas sp. LS44]